MNQPKKPIRRCRLLMRSMLLLLLGSQPGPLVSGAEELGRFFTTPAERARLDAMRRAGPEVTIEISEEELNAAETPKVPVVPLGAITVKGVVYRKDGASTAWVNDSNTYEGDLAAQYIQVPENRIGQDQVELNITGNSTVIKLKVGERYDPATDQTNNLTDKPQQQSTDPSD